MAAKPKHLLVDARTNSARAKAPDSILMTWLVSGGDATQQQSEARSAWYAYLNRSAPARARSDDNWPPAIASRYIRSSHFARLVVEAGEWVLRHYASLRPDVAAGVAIAFEWFDRKASLSERAFDGFLSITHLERYVRRLIYREAIRYARESSREKPVELDVPAMGRDPVEELMSREFVSRAAAALEKLPQIEKKIVLLRLFDGFSNKETARVLGVSTSLSSRAYSRAIEKLAKALRGFAT